jgi:hypothetical protein
VTSERGGRGEKTGETVEVHDSEGDGEVNVIDDGLSASVRSIGEANATRETHLSEVDGPDADEEAPVDAETLRIAREGGQQGKTTPERKRAAFFDLLDACESQEKVADLLSVTQAAVSDRKSRWTDPRPLEDEGGGDETPRIKDEKFSLELNRQEVFEIVHTAPTDTARRVFESVLEGGSK